MMTTERTLVRNSVLLLYSFIGNNKKTDSHTIIRYIVIKQELRVNAKQY